LIRIFGEMSGLTGTYDREGSIRRINQLARSGTPFVFLISFDTNANYILPADDAAGNGLFLDMPGFVNHRMVSLSDPRPEIRKIPVSRERYMKAFQMVREQILYGNSFLLNLTFPTRVTCNYGLGEIFASSRAPFRLYLEDRLAIFSPERFIRISGQSIFAHPMKGTMDASLPDAYHLLTSDSKEDAEHNTIVDLIRNDLGMVAGQIRVKRFKYIDRVRTHRGELLQMSSEITGTLPVNYCERLGDILFSVLPAGSVTGAPKNKTVEIIREAEGYDRGFYAGIFGYWDGRELDSAVAIRYMEQDRDGLVFKSGGGITFQSDPDREYHELLNKVYVPVY